MIGSTIVYRHVDKASNCQLESASWPLPKRHLRARRSGCGRRASAGPQRVLFAAVLACASPFARADCFEEAAGYQHVNPWVLRAIAWQESRGRADAIHRNNNGTVDYGKMQINSIHLRRLSSYGISRDALMHPCINVYVAAWRLREMTNKYGNTWAAVGAYHSETPGERDKYAHAIHSILLRRGVIDE
ncbi:MULTISPECIES: lytic transglycosylase domain-containing protein [Xanthomonas]|uniref:Lytic transglycosylase domain-containing protein n=1 Tax=Xanthomonas manihotis TaxID=43353 RepID=A0A8I1XN69_XANMN|nr:MULTISPECIES: lytic transglycosylase domain-containing protein [Xanthomonas]RWU19416.1 lytic transglycosylase [Xanthomonas phaseoli pv. manihotis str. CIO151]KUF25177.1 lytic transglycosylase [Xanthomonas phaseoli pv. manihotis]MBO9719559.1 lytic transglycosylase domain-containing protein [Xanthomonas phaseoli pv. manihotis]MBO9754481.1 lytic transglycosylase domain-containing protein [Xanthomonas phaseoli pv. manihotis]MBO9761302.1 lytic transglycosylase domain-containing protein [Xanthomo